MAKNPHKLVQVQVLPTDREVLTQMELETGISRWKLVNTAVKLLQEQKPTLTLS